MDSHSPAPAAHSSPAHGSSASDSCDTHPAPPEVRDDCGKRRGDEADEESVTENSVELLSSMDNFMPAMPIPLVVQFAPGVVQLDGIEELIRKVVARRMPSLLDAQLGRDPEQGNRRCLTRGAGHPRCPVVAVDVREDEDIPADLASYAPLSLPEEMFAFPGIPMSVKIVHLPTSNVVFAVIAISHAVCDMYGVGLVCAELVRAVKNGRVSEAEPLSLHRNPSTIADIAALPSAAAQYDAVAGDEGKADATREERMRRAYLQMFTGRFSAKPYEELGKMMPLEGLV